MAKALLISLILLSFFFPISSPVFPTDSVLDAADILSESGFISMSLTLQLVARDLISPSSSITIFAPPDTAFKASGQPSLRLLQYHFSPEKISPEYLTSLPFGDKIDTLYQNHSLIVTTNRMTPQISLNNVTINSSVIYNLGPVVVYGIESFFDPSFQPPAAPIRPPATLIRPPVAPDTVPIASHYLKCAAPYSDYREIVAALEIQNYSVIGAFLDLQLLGNANQTKLTIFAPDDDAMNDEVVNFRDYASIFRGHVVPCKLGWAELLDVEEDTVFPTFLEGFSVTLSGSGPQWSVNGVPVMFEEVYADDNVVVHGIQSLLALPGITGEIDSLSGAKEPVSERISAAAGNVVEYAVLHVFVSLFVQCCIAFSLSMRLVGD